MNTLGRFKYSIVDTYSSYILRMIKWRIIWKWLMLAWFLEIKVCWPIISFYVFEKLKIILHWIFRCCIIGLRWMLFQKVVRWVWLLAWRLSHQLRGVSMRLLLLLVKYRGLVSFPTTMANLSLLSFNHFRILIFVFFISKILLLFVILPLAWSFPSLTLLRRYYAFNTYRRNRISWNH